jgi:hypothetical protein
MLIHNQCSLVSKLKEAQNHEIIHIETEVDKNEPLRINLINPTSETEEETDSKLKISQSQSENYKDYSRNDSKNEQGEDSSSEDEVINMKGKLKKFRSLTL